MILSDFLSRQEIDKSDLHEIIPISFDMKAIFNKKYYKIEEEKGKYLVQTRSQAKERGIKVPEVHGSKKDLDTNLRPEWLVRESSKPSRKYKDREKGDRFSRIKESSCRSSQIQDIEMRIRKSQMKQRIEKIFLNRYMFHKNQ